MADFRKWLFALALVALLLGVGTANAQNPVTSAFTCVANAGNPVIVRSEGLTELVGDLLLQCTGGNPTVAGQPIPASNVTLTLNTNITSRLLATSGFIDALLLIDEPFPASPQPPTGVNRPANSPAQGTPCYSNAFPVPGSCNYLLGTGGGAYGSTTSPYLQSGASTVYVAHTGAGANQVTWLGVPIDAPGTTGNRIVRLTNVRANACMLGISSTLIPTQIVGFVAINGSQFITINNPQQTLAYIQKGLVVSGKGATATQCTNLNKGFTSGQSGTGATTATIKITEGFAASFKRAVFTGSATPVAPLTGSSLAGALPQNIPGYAYNTETALNPDNGGAIGKADFGTRILLRFNNVGSGVNVVLPLYVALSGGNPVPVSGGLGGYTGGFLQLIGSTTDQFGNVGGFTPTTSLTFSDLSGSFASATSINVVGGFASAVYEVVNADPFAIESATIPVGFAYIANPSNNIPAPAPPSASVSVSFAPLSTVGTWDAVAPIPRFCDDSSPINLLTINLCTCNLLFPFVTQAPGFDTGIAVANTSLDPFGTAPQQGTVTFNFYGQGTGGAAVPTSLATMTTTSPVPAGQVLTYTLFSGAGAFAAGLQANPGFTGYLIVQAKFQYCHGFAFISDLGAQKLAEGYLAIQLDAYGGSGLNRTGVIGEVQGQ